MNTTVQYLIISKFDDDAERKRIEYVIDKWRDRVRIDPPETEGMMTVVRGELEDIEGFVEELRAKTSREDNVHTYELNRQELASKERQALPLKVRIKGSRDSAERLLSFIMAKQKAIILPGQDRNAPETAYQVVSRKGRARVTIELAQQDGYISATLRITGFGAVVELLERRLKEEIGYLQEGEQV